MMLIKLIVFFLELTFSNIPEMIGLYQCCLLEEFQVLAMSCITHEDEELRVSSKLD